MNLILMFCAILVGMLIRPSKCAMTEKELKDFMANDYEKKASDMCTRMVQAKWNHQTDLNNEEKRKIYHEATLAQGAFKKDMWQKYFKELNPDDYQDEKVKRQVKMSKILDDAALAEDKLAKLTTTIDSMSDIYNTAKICPYNNISCDLSKDELLSKAEISHVLANSSNYDELLYVWKGWRDASGAKIRNLYKTYVDLSNEAAVANGFKNKGEMWRESYESPTFVQDVEDLWNQVEPLYVQLHKYVSNKLKEVHGDKLDISDGLLPAHVLGDMFAQRWVPLARVVKPFPNASTVDIDQALADQKYTVLEMFKTADHFFKSMGLLPNDICYNTSAGAVIEKPSDGREVFSQPQALDFCDGQNYRILMCTKISEYHFQSVHHEMGHIQYYLQYAKQPYTLREAPNPGFHEAIGETIALSVSSTKHLQKIHLLNDYKDNYESTINTLMDMALQKIAMVPCCLIIDKWRWDVFSGAVTRDNWNSHWWEYRKKYQKLKPPVARSEVDFDPGSQFHVAVGAPYMEYFVAHIVQFQFYRGLCIAAGEYNPDNKKVPLHQCDFYESKAAGEKLRNGLSLGASKHWKDVLEIMTGERKLDATALLEYFEPLHKYLKEKNLTNMLFGNFNLLLFSVILAIVL